MDVGTLDDIWYGSNDSKANGTVDGAIEDTFDGTREASNDGTADCTANSAIEGTWIAYEKVPMTVHMMVQQMVQSGEINLKKSYLMAPLI